MNYDNLQNKGMEELYQFSMEVLKALTAEEEPEKSGSGTFQEMAAYIQKHLSDPNLSAGEISEKFHLTPSYILRIFKKETGTGALDYIHRARIRLGKELLKEGKTVQEAALLLGYIDARGFIRAFKRYEGITPGQFKGM